MTKSISRQGNSLLQGATPAVEPRAFRETALNQARRTLILEAARSAFAERGLDGTSLREIARRAGYTPGAIYSYFANLEEIYGALLSESLQRLKQVVDTAIVATQADKIDPKEELRAKAKAFYAYYRDRPHELDLGFYLFNGAKPRGLTPPLNQRLNDQLLAALQALQTLLTTLGLSTDSAIAETSALLAQIVGILVMSNTGRIRLFNQEPDTLFERYVDALVARLPTANE